MHAYSSKCTSKKKKLKTESKISKYSFFVKCLLFFFLEKNYSQKYYKCQKKPGKLGMKILLLWNRGGFIREVQVKD